MGDLEALFNKAANYVQANATSSDGKKPDDKSLLQLYAFYKVATIGPCNEPQPGLFNLRGKAKWSAWKQMSTMSREEAMQGYIDKVKLVYDFLSEEGSEEASTSKKKGYVETSMGNSVSTLLRVEDEDKEEETIFKWAKDNDLGSIKDWIESNEINMQDENGLTALHWAVDRGHIDACKLLLKYGPDLKICDSDGQTALDYALTCEHSDIITLIKEEMRKQSL